MNFCDTIQIDNHSVGAGHAVFTIAEVGLAHDGSLGMAHAFIDAVSQTGATAIKFQTHIASAESTAQEQFRVRVFPQDASRYAYWERTGFEKSQWIELAEHSREAGLIFLSSPFSNLAIEWLCDCNVPAWKVASGELTNHELLKTMARTGKPVLFSSGMSSWGELDRAVDIVRSPGTPFGMFQCTTSYPCPPEKWGLNIIGEMQERFNCPVGLSDHSGQIAPSIAAVALGASMLEFHVTFHQAQFGPDTRSSLTIEKATELVASVESVRRSLSTPLDKDAQAAELEELHRLFTKSVVAVRQLPKGHVLSKDDFAFKKPGTGWPADQSDQLVGRSLKQAVATDHFFTLDDLV